METLQRFNTINRDLLSFKAFYFFFLSGFGSLFPYLPVYLRQVGLSASHVGLLIGLRPIVQLASAPFWAIMADKYKKRKAILVMSILAWLVMTLALAFVEPTDGICEVRAENENMSRFVNYTKIKTGFFKRSVTISKRYSGDVRKEIKVETSPDLVAVPLKRMFLQDAYRLLETPHVLTPLANKISSTNSFKMPTTKTPEENNKPTSLKLDSTLQSNVLNDRNIFHLNQTSIAPYAEPYWKKIRRKLKKQARGGNGRGFSETKKALQNTRIDHNKKTAGHDTSQFHNNSKIITEVLPARQSKTQRTLPRLLRKKGSAAGVQSKTNKARDIFKISDSNVSQKAAKELDEKAGTLKASDQNNFTNGNRKKHNETHNLKLTSSQKTRHKTKGIVLEFSKGDFANSQSENDKVSPMKSDIDIVASGNGDLQTTGSREEEILNAGNNIVTKNVKEATNRLQKQIAKSVDFLSSMADNSSKSLLHKTIAMLSKKGNATVSTSAAEDQRNISQLSNAFRNLIKSSQKYISSGASVETSTEGSSAFDTEYDFTSLAHLMINQKDGLKTMDSLHQETKGSPNKDVIHHNVLPDHVLAYGHANKTVVLSEDHAQHHNKEPSDSVTSGSGMEDTQAKSFSSNKTSSVVKSTNNSLNRNSSLTIEDSKENVITEEREQEKKSFTRGDEFDMKRTGNMDVVKDEELSGQSETETPEKPGVSPPTESTPSKVQIKLKNVLKTNKLEMSRIFTIFLIIVVVGEFLESPSFTLADASLLERLGENRRFYGKQRLWGSIGFGVCSFIVGILLERSRHVVCGEQYTDYTICFCAFGIMMLLTLFVTTSFDFHYSDVQSSSSSVLSALCNVHYGSCLLAACVMGIDFSMCHNFLTWFLEDLGASKSLMGLAVISRSFADTITFYFAGSIIKSIGQIRVMIMVLISYTVILLTFSILRNPWWAIPVEILDGVTYAMAWSACTSYLAGAVPAESVTTLQGILQGIYWGLGTGSGTITGGYLIHHVGAITTFRLTAGFTFLMCLLFSTVQWKWTNNVPNEYPQTKYTYLPAVESKDTEALLSGYDLPRDKRKCGRIRTKFNNPY